MVLGLAQGTSQYSVLMDCCAMDKESDDEEEEENGEEEEVEK